MADARKPSGVRSELMSAKQVEAGQKREGRVSLCLWKMMHDERRRARSETKPIALDLWHAKRRSRNKEAVATVSKSCMRNDRER